MEDTNRQKELAGDIVERISRLEESNDIVAEEIRELKRRFDTIQKEIKNLKSEVIAGSIQSRSHTLEKLNECERNLLSELSNQKLGLKFAEERIVGRVTGEITLLRREIHRLVQEIESLQNHVTDGHHRILRWMGIMLLIVILFQTGLILMLLQ